MCISTSLLRTGLQKKLPTHNLLICGLQIRMRGRCCQLLPAVLAQDWQLKVCYSLHYQLSTDPLLVRKSCWLRGKATQRQLQNKADNCILGTIVMHLPDTLLKEFKSSHQTFSLICTCWARDNCMFPGYILCPMYSHLHKVSLLMWS